MTAGLNRYGALGTGSVIENEYDTFLPDAIPYVQFNDVDWEVGGDERLLSLSTASGFNCVLIETVATASKTLYCWGTNPSSFFLEGALAYARKPSESPCSEAPAPRIGDRFPLMEKVSRERGVHWEARPGERGSWVELRRVTFHLLPCTLDAEPLAHVPRTKPLRYTRLLDWARVPAFDFASVRPALRVPYRLVFGDHADGRRLQRRDHSRQRR